MYDAENIKFKFSRLRRHLKRTVHRQDFGAKPNLANHNGAPTQLYGEINPRFGTDLYFAEICRRTILISLCSGFFLKRSLHVCVAMSVSIRTNFKPDLISWLTVARLAPNILSGSTTSRITRCDWPNFHFRALFGWKTKCVTPVFHDQNKVLRK